MLKISDLFNKQNQHKKKYREAKVFKPINQLLSNLTTTLELLFSMNLVVLKNVLVYLIMISLFFFCCD